MNHKKNFKSKYTNEEKLEIMEKAFNYLNVAYKTNQTTSTFYFEYEGIEYRASLHHQPEFFVATWGEFKGIELISNSYDNLSKKIMDLKGEK